eukprot:gene25652-31368_t
MRKSLDREVPNKWGKTTSLRDTRTEAELPTTKANTDAFYEDVKRYAPGHAESCEGGAKLAALLDTDAQDMAQLLSKAQKQDAVVTALEALADFLATNYGEERPLPLQRGFPLETQYGKARLERIWKGKFVDEHSNVAHFATAVGTTAEIPYGDDTVRYLLVLDYRSEASTSASATVVDAEPDIHELLSGMRWDAIGQPFASATVELRRPVSKGGVVDNWVLCGDGTLRVWDLKAAIKLGANPAHTGRVRGCEIGGGGGIITAGEDGVFRIWKKPMKAREGPPPSLAVEVEADVVLGCDWSEDSMWIAVATGSRGLLIYSTLQQKGHKGSDHSEENAEAEGEEEVDREGMEGVDEILPAEDVSPPDEKAPLLASS